MATACDLYCMDIPLWSPEFRSALDVGRPVGGVDFRGVLQESHELVELFIGEVELGHLTTTRGSGGHCLHPAHDELGATTLVDVAEFRREIGTFTQQGMAAKTVACFPDVLAGRDFRGDCGAVVAIREFALGVESKRQEQEEEEHRSPVEDVPRH